MLQKILGGILGCALLLYGGTAAAFTLVIFPPTQEEQALPSTSVTEATTLLTQIQPIAGAIRTQLLGLRRPRAPATAALAGRMLAASDYVSSRSDADFLMLASNGASTTGASKGNALDSLWISSTYNSLENDFFRTRFHGSTHNFVAGYDLTTSDKYVLGLAVNHEASTFVTDFNVGSEKTRGFNVSPYFAYLLSDSWSFDLSLGYGEFDTRQSRSLATTLGPIPANSEVSSTREFASVNLTNILAWGNWKLTDSAGFLAAKRSQDPYVEQLAGTQVAGTSQTVRQWNLTGEVAYGRAASEGFVGLMYERTRNPPKIEFATGEQPANDPDGVVLTAGWRHFGKGLTTNFVFSSRQGQDQVNEYGFAMTLRIDL